MRTSLPNLTTLAHDIRLELVDITAIEPTGSAYTCNPPVLDTDIDFICKVESMPEFKAVAVDLGWEPYEPDPDSDEEEEYDLGDEGDFISFRRDDINLIVTQHQSFYDEYVLATSLCKRFNLLEKQDRCDLFSAIIDGPPRPKEEKLKNPELVKEAGLDIVRHRARETLRAHLEGHVSALLTGSLDVPTSTGRAAGGQGGNSAY